MKLLKLISLIGLNHYSLKNNMEKYAPILKAIKEPLRLLILALLPFALAYFEVIDTNLAISITVGLRFLDKALHEVGKESGNESVAKGLVRF